MAKPVISADSHVMEPPNCYLDNIEPKYRDRAPHIVERDGIDYYVIPGLEKPVPMALISAAGKDPEKMRMYGGKFEDLHLGGHDPKARMADQDLDGVSAEILYASIGMAICSHPDTDYKQACFKAYNRWLEGFCAAEPNRLFGMAQTALPSLEEGLADFRAIKAAGFKGVMMPGVPGFSDYDDRAFDPLWELAVDLDLPISFHVLTTGDSHFKSRGPKINSWHTVIRSCQDIVGMFVYGGVFERNPKLKLVCVEADAGWLPHFLYRMDHAYNRHRHWMKGMELSRMPSEWVKSNVWFTFQDDWTAFKYANDCNPRRLMWGNDFPHSDSTWPRSQELLAEHTKYLSDEQRDWILHDNCVELYGLDLGA